MTEIAFALSGALNGLFFYLMARAGADERRRLVNMVSASTPAEFVALERATTPRRPRRDDDAPRPEVPLGL